MAATSSPSPSQNDVLNSWKDIAKYMDRGVRTVQRWELELALPVRRPRGKRRSGVLALRSDLDLWLRHCPGDHAVASPAPALDPLVQLTTSELISQSRQLRAELARARHEFSRVRIDLFLSVQRLSSSFAPARGTRQLPAR